MRRSVMYKSYFPLFVTLLIWLNLLYKIIFRTSYSKFL